MRAASLATAFDLERIAKGLIRELGLLSTEVRRRERSIYTTQAWKELRYRVLAKSGQRCQCCGSSVRDGAELHVDHIKPRSLYPDLALDESNLQVLCSDCNMGKSNRDDTDFRPALTPDQVDQARRLRAEGLSVPAVAERLRVHATTVYRALYRTQDDAKETWLREEVVPAARELEADPSKALTGDQVREHLTARRSQKRKNH
ncbi:MAG: HNH endonuclease [Rhizobiales bacterium]|nr:HNH endonuclease [Hyphomicrobiales bacterium]